MPLISNGRGKKTVMLSTGLADIDLTAKLNVDVAIPYAISKAALNAAMAKFSAQYAAKGILFLSICPGVVETGQNNNGMYK